VTDLIADAVALLAGGFTPGAHLLAMLYPELASAFPRFLPRQPGFLPCLDRSFTRFGTPLPEAVPIASRGEQNHSQQAKDQQFHGVIDEGNRDLFRKIIALQNRGFLDGAAFGEALHIQVLSVDHASLPGENQIRENATRGGRMHHAVAAKTVGEVESPDIGRGS